MANDPSSAVTTLIAFIDSKISKEQEITNKKLHDWRHNHQKSASKAKTSVIENALGREINLTNLPHLLKVSYHQFPHTQVLIDNIIKQIDATRFPELGLQQGSSLKEKIKNIPNPLKRKSSNPTLNPLTFNPNSKSQSQPISHPPIPPIITTLSQSASASAMVSTPKRKRASLSPELPIPNKSLTPTAPKKSNKALTPTSNKEKDPNPFSWELPNYDFPPLNPTTETPNRDIRKTLTLMSNLFRENPNQPVSPPTVTPKSPVQSRSDPSPIPQPSQTNPTPIPSAPTPSASTQPGPNKDLRKYEKEYNRQQRYLNHIAVLETHVSNNTNPSCLDPSRWKVPLNMLGDLELQEHLMKALQKTYMEFTLTHLKKTVSKTQSTLQTLQETIPIDTQASIKEKTDKHLSDSKKKSWEKIEKITLKNSTPKPKQIPALMSLKITPPKVRQQAVIPPKKTPIPSLMSLKLTPPIEKPSSHTPSTPSPPIPTTSLPLPQRVNPLPKRGNKIVSKNPDLNTIVEAPETQ